MWGPVRFLVGLAIAHASPVFTSATHYGNPYDGACLSGEKNITDLKGGDTRWILCSDMDGVLYDLAMRPKCLFAAT